MAEPALSVFVKEALASGASRASIQEHLKQAGWANTQIKNALGEFSTVDFVVPIPKPTPQFMARDTFLYLTMFTMLYISAWNLGNLLFQFIHLGLPDANYTRNEDTVRRAIRFSTSALIIAVPVFLFICAKIANHIKQEPALRASPVRQWLTYLTLGIVVCILVGDMITLLYTFLSGELSLRFVLKTLIVAAIAGGVFYYYLYLIRQDNEVAAV
ncbi:DUF5671 domain-containing protein [SAR92 clade bacterium H231]|nr:DUF5671 domain-containing protein [SAR92 clade bacterium H231]